MNELKDKIERLELILNDRDERLNKLCDKIEELESVVKGNKKIIAILKKDKDDTDEAWDCYLKNFS